MVHNHNMVSLEKRHYMRSQKSVSDEQLKFIVTLKNGGVKVADALRALKKEVGGSPFFGFKDEDAYNALSVEKAEKLDGYDSHQLIRLFAKR